MANPNILSLSSIYFKNFEHDVTTSYGAVYTCPASTAAKVKTLMVSNIDGTNDADVSVKWKDNSNADKETEIAKTIVVPAGASLGLLDGPLYLEESDSIQALASANSDLQITGSVEEYA